MDYGNDIDADRGAEQSGLFADLCAKIDITVGSVDKLTAALNKPKRRPPAQPVFGRVASSGVFSSAAGELILAFPIKGPDQGHFWYIRSIVIGGLDPTVTATGRADVFVSALNLQALTSIAAIGLADWRDTALTLPDISFYGRGEIPLRLNEELFVVITGATNGQQYVAAVQFEDYEEGATQQEWGM